MNNLAGDIAGHVRSEQDGSVGDIGGGAHASQGERSEHGRPHLLHLFGRGVEHVFTENGAEIGRCRPGSDTVHTDAGLAFLGESAERLLRGVSHLLDMSQLEPLPHP